MASTEPLAGVQVEPLGPLDGPTLAMLDELVVQSRWNQTGDDWGVFARHGAIRVVRDGAGHIVASGAVLPMGASTQGGSIAWISMILVTPSERGRGLGRAVFDDCLRTAQRAGHVPMLDATPQGEPLYRQFGFEPQWHLTRWRRGAVPATAAALSCGVKDLEGFAAKDAQALGFTRSGLLHELLSRPDSRCVRIAGAIGMVRQGRIAHQIGPVLSPDEASAVDVLRCIADACPGPLVIDASDERADFARALAAAGFERERTFTRMALANPGQTLPQGNTLLINAIAGPEFA